MPHLNPLNADRIHQHAFLHQFIHIIICRICLADLFVQAVGADGGDPLFADVTGLALRVEKCVVRDQAGGDGQIFMLEVHHIDRIAQDPGGRVHQILQPISRKQGIDQEMHPGGDLLELGQIFQAVVEQRGFRDGRAEIGHGKGTAVIAGKICPLPAAEKGKFRWKLRIRQAGGRTQIKRGRVKNSLGRIPEPGKQQIPGGVLPSKYLRLIAFFS